MAEREGAWPLPDWNTSTDNILHTTERSEKPFGVTAQYTFAPPVRTRKHSRLWVVLAMMAVIVAIVGTTIGALFAAKVVHTKSNMESDSQLAADGGSPTTSTSPTPTSSAVATSTSKVSTCPTADDIPSDAKGTWLDTTSWLDMRDFNCTFTDKMVGGLPIAGLNSTWNDTARANPNVPALNQTWPYGTLPIRGVNLGGWLSLEPFITPSLFDAVPGAVDEYTLCQKLGTKAAQTLEEHYSTFITEDDFKAIAAAGLDHVRIPYSYWAVRTYDGDPYVANVSWRYLLRAIEWARKYGLRVSLDLHAVPGSQNGWNHSGRQGSVDWIVGPDGALNAQRSLDIHQQLATFFAQPRYNNVVTFYGLVNEPSKDIPLNELEAWTSQAYNVIHGAGFNSTQVFSEALRGLPAWQGQLQGYGNSLALDVHEYLLFDDALISKTHAEKVGFACETYKETMTASINTATGFGPTMVGEWSQADTDCQKYLNGVGMGSRWLDTFNADGSQPNCPTHDKQCSCDLANADASTFSADYKLFLKTFAEAQMSAFEIGWGWFYWTWKTESAPLWSYQAALEGGFMPPIAYQHDWDCSQPVPSFGSLPETY
ncbi:uncharacterized protein PV09_06670 [Verruconis gallopava]|uniref:glucan 1,3-beta-glucosidase n=1 Tax=Verruconis gallopava TaxID=253628 RepID=A0A0D1YLW1_9PEZI|nr:uncharacterized protein PV09_06670 [Verruconis gallopava]KIW01817.1 hypothetical protein PV09_06670 [Verruconis gallopava]